MPPRTVTTIAPIPKRAVAAVLPGGAIDGCGARVTAGAVQQDAYEGLS